MMPGDGAIFSSGSSDIELVQQDTCVGSLVSSPGPGSFSFTSDYEAGDEFVVLGFGINASVVPVESGWTTELSVSNHRIWHRTLGSSDNPNDYSFQTGSGFDSVGLFIGYIVRNWDGTNITSDSNTSASLPYDITLSGLANPAVCMAAATNLASTNFMGITAAYDDLTQTVSSPESGALRGGSDTVSGSSETITTSSSGSKSQDPYTLGVALYN